MVVLILKYISMLNPTFVYNKKIIFKYWNGSNDGLAFAVL